MNPNSLDGLLAAGAFAQSPGEVRETLAAGIARAKLEQQLLPEVKSAACLLLVFWKQAVRVKLLLEELRASGVPVPDLAWAANAREQLAFVARLMIAEGCIEPTHPLLADVDLSA